MNKKDFKRNKLKGLRYEKWEVIGKSIIKNLRSRTSSLRGKQKSKIGRIELKASDIIDILLENRGITTRRKKEEFFNPVQPEKVPLKDLKIDPQEVSKTIKRIKKAKENGEKIIIYGDYDADGICATAILWESLYGLGFDVTPHIPDRFEEGYGLNADSIQNLKISTFAKASADKKNSKLGLIVTVDNGIVANEAVEEANKLGIDVIITDHHQPGKNLPKAYSIIHTDKISGSGVAWILSREIRKRFKIYDSRIKNSGLDLAAIGTIADQLPLLGPNRSFAKYGLEALNQTNRVGLLALMEKGRIQKGSIGTYEINYIIAPRINAMGRLEHGVESLRLLCTKNRLRAETLATLLNKTNLERQKIVDEVVVHARGQVSKDTLQSVLVLAHESYHEGVIGLAAAKLVEEFHRPSIVISKGKIYSKASARSIAGFNIIEAIRKLGGLIEGGGGHPMAAGFTIATEKISLFSQKIEEVANPLLTNEVLSKKLKIDLNLHFNRINNDLYGEIKKFEPTGIGNPTPVFVTEKANIYDVRCVGSDRSHLKLKLKEKEIIFDAIAFGMGEYYSKLSPGKPMGVAYTIEEDLWNGNEKLQLKVRDFRYGQK